MEKHIEILVDRAEHITKEEAYKAINEQYHETGLDGYQDGIELVNHIAKIPAADVVEVVRCRDCIHRPSGTGVNHDLDFPDDKCPCQCIDDPWYSWMPLDDWYCASGERKDGGLDDA